MRGRRKSCVRIGRLESLESRSLMAVDGLSLDNAQYDPNHILVQFQTPTPAAVIGTRAGGATVTRQVSSDGWFQARLAPGASVSSALEAFQNRNDVVIASPDFRVQVNALPNDPSYASQWALENTADADIDAATAWNYGTSSSVVVAVIDSGIDYTHVDLASNIWTNPREVAGNGRDDDGNGYVDDVRGWNFVANNNNPMDDNGHGTHVAGTIGAVGNNGIGISGVAWNVKMMALKFLDSSGSGVLSDAVAAIDYARVNGAKIVNASWGGGGFSSALQAAIQRFQNSGGVFVAAAGNEARNNAQTASYPANYALANVISVAASTRSDTLASFSNYGTNVDIAAPGAGILSTVPGNAYASYSGTSMATPHVAGALALLWGQSPALTATQLIDLVMANTDAVLRSQTIHGRLNVGKAATALNGNAGGGDTVSPFVVGATWNQTAVGISSVDVTFSEAMRASSLNTTAIQIIGPSGAIPVTSIAAVNGGTIWRISFANQTAAGVYTLTVLPNVSDTSGNLLDQDRDGVAGETTQDRFLSQTTRTSIGGDRSFTRNGPVSLADATYFRTGVTRIAIDVTEAFTVADLNVNVSIDHTYVSDLRIRLIAPDGTSVQLVNRRGGYRDNIRVAFDDEAGTSIASAVGDLAGSFQPEQSLSAFDGKNSSGRWVLEVTDAARLDVGQLNSVTLQFNSSGAVPAASNTASSVDWFNFTVDFIDRLLRRSRIG